LKLYATVQGIEIYKDLENIPENNGAMNQS
jgi:hypothetical protein